MPSWRHAPILVYGLLFFWAAGSFPVTAGDDDRVPLVVKVVAASGEKPIANASVYVDFKDKPGFIARGKKRRWHVKTNREGLARLPGVAPGKVLIQVIAEGWKTFGKYYDIGAEKKGKRKVIEIKLQRPRRWY
ncbi:MAG: hypothetical protein ACE5H2_01290 [Terriglobia bacterium]